jgi:uncharacterized delta-60 repeat protein
MFADIDITLNIQSNVNYTTTANILGSSINLLDTSNATTEYRWNVTSFSFTNENSVSVQYKINGATNFSTFNAGIGSQSFQSVVNALNNLGIGTFNTYTEVGQVYIGTYNQNYAFGNLNIYLASTINQNFVYGTGLQPFGGVYVTTPNNQIYVGGNFVQYNGTSTSFMANINIDGSLNTNFNPTNNGTIYFTAVQSDGKILVGGSFTLFNGVTANSIVRINQDGTTDTTFNSGTGFDSVVNCITIQPNGQILLGGFFTTYNGGTANRIIRLNSDGSKDTSFVYGTGFNNTTYQILLLSNGQIYVSGLFNTYNGGFGNVNLIRLNSNGSKDTTFSSGVPNFSGINALSLQSDNKLIVGGAFTTWSGNTAGHIIRLNTNGSVDTTFNSGTGFDATILSTAIMSNGQILCGGQFTSYNGTTSNYIARLNSSGSYDTAWNIGSGFDLQVNSLSILNGQLYCTGDFTQFNGVSANYIISLNL